MSLLYTKGDKIFIKREGTIEMPNRSHFAARRKRNLTVPLLALFLLIGFAAGLAVPRLGSSAPAVSAADGTASGKPDSSASSAGCLRRSLYCPGRCRSNRLHLPRRAGSRRPIV